MHVSPWKKTIAATLSLCYLTTQIALGNQVELSVWNERRLSAAALASVGPTMRLSAKEFSEIPPPVSQNPLGRLIAALPTTHGTIQQIYDPGSAASPIAIIQDVHMNIEAQSNIATVLQRLIDRRQVASVGVEGAFTVFDFSSFRQLADQAVVRKQTQKYFDENRLAAPSFVGITSANEPPLFIGVDDRVHYDANVRAYRDTLSVKNRVRAEIERNRQELEQEKAGIFSGALKQFDEARARYHEARIGLGEYSQTLTDLSEGDAGETLARFVRAYDIEKSLDFNQVENQRKTALESLARRLNDKEINDLVAQSAGYRLGRITLGKYFSDLGALFERKSVSLTHVPAFKRYVDYVALAEQIHAHSLLKEIAATEKKLALALTKTPLQKELLNRSEQLALTEKLLSFSLTPDEWLAYKQHPAAGMLRPFEQFYEEADIRSQAIVDQMSRHAKGAAALIVGGFHTPEITRRLREKKIPYVVVSPKITHVDEARANAYLSVFDREKTPLEKLLAGEKLFLAPADRNITDAGTRRTLWMSIFKALSWSARISVIVLVLPAIETFAFQYTGLQVVFIMSGNYWVSVCAIAVLSAATHAAIDLWRGRPIKLVVWRAVVTAAAFVAFSLPFHPGFQFDRETASLLAMMMHTLYNGVALSLGFKWLPPASLVAPEESEKPTSIFILSSAGTQAYLKLNLEQLKFMRAIGELYTPGLLLRPDDVNALPKLNQNDVQIDFNRLVSDADKLVQAHAAYIADDPGTEELAAASFQTLVEKTGLADARGSFSSALNFMSPTIELGDQIIEFTKLHPEFSFIELKQMTGKTISGAETIPTGTDLLTLRREHVDTKDPITDAPLSYDQFSLNPTDKMMASIPMKEKSPEEPPAVYSISKMIADSLTLLLNTDIPVRRRLMLEAEFDQLTVGRGYRSKEKEAALPVMGALASLSEPARNYYLEKSERLGALLDGDFFMDAIARLASKASTEMQLVRMLEGRETQFLQFLKTYLENNFVVSSNASETEKINALNELAKIFRRPAVAKAGPVHRFIREESKLTAIEHVAIGRIDINATPFEIVGTGDAQTPDEFIEKFAGKSNSSKILLYHTAFEENGAAWVLAIRDGKAEIYNNSKTYSAIAGFRLFRQNHSIECTLDEKGRAQIHWIVKDAVEMISYLPLEASLQLNAMLTSNHITSDPSRTALTQFMDAMVKIGAAFDRDSGQQMVKDPTSKTISTIDVEYDRVTSRWEGKGKRDKRPPQNPASIVDPVVRGLSKTHPKLYKAATIGGAAAWETAVFQFLLYANTNLNIFEVAFLFAIAHTIVAWIVRAYRGFKIGYRTARSNELSFESFLRVAVYSAARQVFEPALQDTKNFIVHFALSILFTVPFLFVGDAIKASFVAFALHAAYNAFALAKGLTLASIIPFENQEPAVKTNVGAALKSIVDGYQGKAIDMRSVERQLRELDSTRNLELALRDLNYEAMQWSLPFSKNVVGHVAMLEKIAREINGLLNRHGVAFRAGKMDADNKAMSVGIYYIVREIEAGNKRLLVVKKSPESNELLLLDPDQSSMISEEDTPRLAAEFGINLHETGPPAASAAPTTAPARKKARTQTRPASNADREQLYQRIQNAFTVLSALPDGETDPQKLKISIGEANLALNNQRQIRSGLPQPNGGATDTSMGIEIPGARKAPTLKVTLDIERTADGLVLVFQWPDKRVIKGEEREFTKTYRVYWENSAYLREKQKRIQTINAAYKKLETADVGAIEDVGDISALLIVGALSSEFPQSNGDRVGSRLWFGRGEEAFAASLKIEKTSFGFILHFDSDSSDGKKKSYLYSENGKYYADHVFENMLLKRAYDKLATAEVGHEEIVPRIYGLLSSVALSPRFLLPNGKSLEGSAHFGASKHIESARLKIIKQEGVRLQFLFYQRKEGEMEYSTEPLVIEWNGEKFEELNLKMDSRQSGVETPAQTYRRHAANKDWAAAAPIATENLENLSAFWQSWAINLRLTKLLASTNRLGLLSGLTLHLGSGPSISHRAWLLLRTVLLALNVTLGPSVDIDKEPEMLRLTRERYEKEVERIPKELWSTQEVGVMENLSKYADESVGRVENGSITLSDDIETTIRESNRVLTKGGLMRLSTNARKFSPDFIESLRQMGFEILEHEDISMDEDYEKILRESDIASEDIGKIKEKIEIGGEYIFAIKTGNAPKDVRGLKWTFVESDERSTAATSTGKTIAPPKTYDLRTVVPKLPTPVVKPTAPLVTFNSLDRELGGKVMSVLISLSNIFRGQGAPHTKLLLAHAKELQHPGLEAVLRQILDASSGKDSEKAVAALGPKLNALFMTLGVYVNLSDYTIHQHEIGLIRDVQTREGKVLLSVETYSTASTTDRPIAHMDGNLSIVWRELVSRNIISQVHVAKMEQSKGNENLKTVITADFTSFLGDAFKATQLIKAIEDNRGVKESADFQKIVDAMTASFHSANLRTSQAHWPGSAINLLSALQLLTTPLFALDFYRLLTYFHSNASKDAGLAALFNALFTDGREEAFRLMIQRLQKSEIAELRRWIESALQEIGVLGKPLPPVQPPTSKAVAFGSFEQETRDELVSFLALLTGGGKDEAMVLGHVALKNNPRLASVMTELVPVLARSDAQKLKAMESRVNDVLVTFGIYMDVHDIEHSYAIGLIEKVETVRGVEMLTLKKFAGEGEMATYRSDGKRSLAWSDLALADLQHNVQIAFEEDQRSPQDANLLKLMVRDISVFFGNAHMARKLLEDIKNKRDLQSDDAYLQFLTAILRTAHFVNVNEILSGRSDLRSVWERLLMTPLVGFEFLELNRTAGRRESYLTTTDALVMKQMINKAGGQPKDMFQFFMTHYNGMSSAAFNRLGEWIYASLQDAGVVVTLSPQEFLRELNVKKAAATTEPQQKRAVEFKSLKEQQTELSHLLALFETAFLNPSRANLLRTYATSLVYGSPPLKQIALEAARVLEETNGREKMKALLPKLNDELIQHGAYIDLADFSEGKFTIGTILQVRTFHGMELLTVSTLALNAKEKAPIVSVDNKRSVVWINQVDAFANATIVQSTEEPQRWEFVKRDLWNFLGPSESQRLIEAVRAKRMGTVPEVMNRIVFKFVDAFHFANLTRNLSGTAPLAPVYFYRMLLSPLFAYDFASYWSLYESGQANNDIRKIFDSMVRHVGDIDRLKRTYHAQVMSNDFEMLRALVATSIQSANVALPISYREFSDAMDQPRGSLPTGSIIDPLLRSKFKTNAWTYRGLTVFFSSAWETGAFHWGLASFLSLMPFIGPFSIFITAILFSATHTIVAWRAGALENGKQETWNFVARALLSLLFSWPFSYFDSLPYAILTTVAIHAAYNAFALWLGPRWAPLASIARFTPEQQQAVKKLELVLTKHSKPDTLSTEELQSLVDLRVKYSPRGEDVPSDIFLRIISPQQALTLLPSLLNDVLSGSQQEAPDISHFEDEGIEDLYDSDNTSHQKRIAMVLTLAQTIEGKIPEFQGTVSNLLRRVSALQQARKYGDERYAADLEKALDGPEGNVRWINELLSRADAGLNLVKHDENYQLEPSPPRVEPSVYEGRSLSVPHYYDKALAEAASPFSTYEFHDGAYSALAVAQRERDGQSIAILNVDPHTDVMDKHGRLVDVVHDANWMAHALHDGLAEVAVQMILPSPTDVDQSPQFIVYETAAGGKLIHRKVNASELAAIFKDRELFLTIDADSFSLGASVTTETGTIQKYHFDSVKQPEQFEARLDLIRNVLTANDLHPFKVVVAESPMYLNGEGVAKSSDYNEGPDSPHRIDVPSSTWFTHANERFRSLEAFVRKPSLIINRDHAQRFIDAAKKELRGDAHAHDTSGDLDFVAAFNALAHALVEYQQGDETVPVKSVLDALIEDAEELRPQGLDEYLESFHLLDDRAFVGDEAIAMVNFLKKLDATGSDLQRVYVGPDAPLWLMLDRILHPDAAPAHAYFINAYSLMNDEERRDMTLFRDEAHLQHSAGRTALDRIFDEIPATLENGAFIDEFDRVYDRETKTPAAEALNPIMNRLYYDFSERFPLEDKTIQIVCSQGGKLALLLRKALINGKPSAKVEVVMPTKNDVPYKWGAPTPHIGFEYLSHARLIEYSVDKTKHALKPSFHLSSQYERVIAFILILRLLEAKAGRIAAMPPTAALLHRFAAKLPEIKRDKILEYIEKHPAMAEPFSVENIATVAAEHPGTLPWVSAFGLFDTSVAPDAAQALKHILSALEEGGYLLFNVSANASVYGLPLAVLTVLGNRRFIAVEGMPKNFHLLQKRPNPAVPLARALSQNDPDVTIRQVTDWVQAKPLFENDNLGAQTPLSWIDMRANLAKGIDVAVKHGAYRTIDERRRLADFIFALKSVLSSDEYRDFVGSINGYLDTVQKYNQPEDVVIMLDNDPQIARKQAEDWIGNLKRNEQGAIPSSKRVLLAANNVAVAEAVASLTADRIFVQRRHETAAKFIDTISEKREGVRYRFVVLEKSDVPENYFDLSGIDAPIARAIVVDLVLESMDMVIQLRKSLLPDWREARKTLVAA